MIIVGTHLDQVSEQKAEELKARAFEKYSNASIYPKVSPTAIKIRDERRLLTGCLV